MFLKLSHTNLEVYRQSYALTQEAYKLTTKLPASERFILIDQIRRAAISIHLNIAEGSSRRSSAERRRYFEIARGSVIEIDAALEIAIGLKYIDSSHVNHLGELIVNTFKLLTGLISKTT